MWQAVGKYLKRNMESVSGRKLTQRTYDAVVKLCEDDANTVFIVSGLNDKGLMHVSHHVMSRDATRHDATGRDAT